MKTWRQYFTQACENNDLAAYHKALQMQPDALSQHPAEPRHPDWMHHAAAKQAANLIPLLAQGGVAINTPANFGGLTHDPDYTGVTPILRSALLAGNEETGHRALDTMVALAEHGAKADARAFNRAGEPLFLLPAFLNTDPELKPDDHLKLLKLRAHGMNINTGDRHNEYMLCMLLDEPQKMIALLKAGARLGLALDISPQVTPEMLRDTAFIRRISQDWGSDVSNTMKVLEQFAEQTMALFPPASHGWTRDDFIAPDGSLKEAIPRFESLGLLPPLFTMEGIARWKEGVQGMREAYDALPPFLQREIDIIPILREAPLPRTESAVMHYTHGRLARHV